MLSFYVVPCHKLVLLPVSFGQCTKFLVSSNVLYFLVFQFLMVLVMLCWTDLFDYHLTVDEKTNEDLTQSFSDKSRGLLQTSDSTEQSVFSSECVGVDTSNQLDTAEDCKQSDTPCDDQMRVESGKHSCEVCTKTFTRSNHLKSHMLIHTAERPFSCKVCNKKFRRSFSLKSHMLIHTGESPFSCKVCNKKFTVSSSLKSHMLIHTGESPFSCKVCNTKFRQSCHLKCHMFIHTGERPFSCKVCNQNFTRSAHLKRHMLIHAGERSFCCKLCNKKFTQLYGLKRHMVSHTGERPFSCKVCHENRA